MDETNFDTRCLLSSNDSCMTINLRACYDNPCLLNDFNAERLENQNIFRPLYKKWTNIKARQILTLKPGPWE